MKSINKVVNRLGRVVLASDTGLITCNCCDFKIESTESTYSTVVDMIKEHVSNTNHRKYLCTYEVEIK